MALYAFDGTWQEDEPDLIDDTNVGRFVAAYDGRTDYVGGVGTRYGVVGRIIGGLFGAGGQTRIEEMYGKLVANWQAGDETIDIVGFSRGAALAVHFANVIADQGVRKDGETLAEPRIRFLGLWDTVASFGIPLDVVMNFHDINIGYDLGVPGIVDCCYHAMALHERREAFGVVRLDRADKRDNVEEVWFRGVHSDVGGGGGNPGLASIALGWMLEKAQDNELPVDAGTVENILEEADPLTPIGDNFDPFLDPRRKVLKHDALHPSAQGTPLGKNETREFVVNARHRYSPTGVRMIKGQHYTFTIPPNQTWTDSDITCGPEGWKSEDLPWYREFAVELFEQKRRCRTANWFELIGALGDFDDHFFRIAAGGEDRTFTAPEDGVLYAFANDLYSKYGNNQGSMKVTIKRVSRVSRKKLKRCGDAS